MSERTVKWTLIWRVVLEVMLGEFYSDGWCDHILWGYVHLPNHTDGTLGAESSVLHLKSLLT
jgi:hypothetical protein